MILVVGATAHFGRQTVEALLAAGEPVRALTRNPEATNLPAGVDIAQGDLTQPHTLAPALDGVTAIFLILPYGLDPAPLLKEAGDRRIVFLSSGAIVDDLAVQPDVIATYHRGVEQAIIDTGAQWTFLRIFFPAINTLSFAMQLTDSDVVRAPYQDATSSAIHEQDVADVAARVLTDDAHAHRIYHLTGPGSMTQQAQVHTLGTVLGRPLRFEELDPAPVRQQLSQFMDTDFVNALFDLMAATVGIPATVNTTVEDITGTPPRSYAQWVADHINDFR